MKCTTIADPSRDEEVIIYVKERSRISDAIEGFVRECGHEIVGYLDTETKKISASEIIYLTVENGKVYAVTEGGRLVIKERLYVLEDMLGAEFIKINQSCLARVAAIRSFDTSIGGAMRVLFSNGERDFVSRRQLKTVKERFLK